ncbi:SprT-like family-domain-containing protein [Annulohypoxylon maeteangense]|uniref:SprT-like family-domain-containing protein n=1 Tax=Annulohypoxylon maeteangense TaxID=1927788 RepID=UPI0020082ED3|nr:SprT-like family-domain-containing protein [Annulohypoxylon maeteangense]KAI0880421.1 SprT-like family-domain-containing protein [Annulohypoxylon maeteangense]
MLGALGDSSEDEFPDVDVVVRQYRHKVKDGREQEDCDNVNISLRDSNEHTSRKGRNVKNTPVAKATPLRRRKLGQTQTNDESLLKPWGKTVASKDEKSRTSNPRGSRTRVRVKEESVEPDFSPSSKNVPEAIPARARQQGYRAISSGTDLKPVSRKTEKPQRDNDIESSNMKIRQIPKKSAKSSIPSDESDDESDISKDVQESSEEEVSEFVSGSGSETDASDSNSEQLVTPPTRRSRSPAVWTKPQRTLFKDSDKKSAPSNKQPQATIIDPTNRPSKQRGTLNILKAPQSRNLEDAFQKLKIFNEDSEPDEPSIKIDKKLILEPTTPRKTLKAVPASPLKTPRIPASPWKPEHKEFWDSEVHFGWIDKHSPEKKPESPQKPKPKPKPTAQELKMEAKRKYGVSPEKKDARKAFDAIKESLARVFLRELDDRITDGKLAKLTEDTGGLRIEWSNTLRSTAGRAHWKCKTQSTTTKNAEGVTTSVRETRQHTAFIELATRVLSNESDLLNTVAHEFCHLAVFILNGKPKAAHGAEFKALGAQCGRAFADRGIIVTTKHDYEIEYKYIWECEGCQGQIKRHSRSVNAERQKCGRCRGALRQVKPTPRGGGGGGTDVGGGPATVKKKLSPWNEFLSLEMKALSQSNPRMSFKEKMAVVSTKWNEIQRQQKQEKMEVKEDKEEKRKKTIIELQTAVEILNINDGGDDDDDGDDDNGNDNDNDEKEYGEIKD